MQTIIIIGRCVGYYSNVDVSKRFDGKMLAVVRPNGSLVVQDLGAGIRPICYIGAGANISINMKEVGSELELLANTEDDQKLSLKFDQIYSMAGIPEDE